MPELLTDRETGPQRPDWLAALGGSEPLCVDLLLKAREALARQIADLDRKVLRLFQSGFGRLVILKDLIGLIRPCVAAIG